MPPQNETGGQGRQRFVELLRRGLESSGLSGNARLLVAISGGADSTALLLGLHEISADSAPSIEIQAAHFNHQLRGERSNSDERYCRRLCNELEVQLHTGTGDVSAHAAATRASVEAAARDLRYRFLAKMVSGHELDAVVTGHTMDDQAETVLLAITRGAGLRGISGMSATTERHDLLQGGDPLRVLRPMLGIRRSETERYCELAGYSPVQDETNIDQTYARNRVRHAVIPELRNVNPRVVESISRLAAITADDLAMIDEMADSALTAAAIDGSGGISRGALREMHPALKTHVLAAAYRKALGSVRDLDMVSLVASVEAVDGPATGSVDLPNGVKLLVEHDTVRFLIGEADPACPYPERVEENVLPILGTLKFPGGGVLTARITWPAPEPESLSKWQTIINPAVVEKRRLTVRARRDGDRFHPLGMDGEMKLQDFFVNQHVPARWRDRVPLVLAAHGICWVVGERVAEWAKVPDGASEAVLLEYTPTE